ncbi:hypothetical protein [Natribacillus halophilus]|uniref:Uncharacterized protein n=1 Tax=Natribacillus halophilus TaxID=549003 RepID=A0A1G8SIS0_9BACI|nr:hypothetical protein [Natribacillus halophilus]SDJ29097.1 hypothetical protein SAMN04488123_12911 [Natribacillus halophilus]
MDNSMFPLKVFSRWFTNDTGVLSSTLKPVTIREKHHWIIRFPVKNMTVENVNIHTDKDDLFIRFQQTIEEKHENETTGAISAYQAITECTSRTAIPPDADEKNYTIVCCEDHVDIYFNMRKGDDY